MGVISSFVTNRRGSGVCVVPARNASLTQPMVGPSCRSAYPAMDLVGPHRRASPPDGSRAHVSSWPTHSPAGPSASKAPKSRSRPVAPLSPWTRQIPASCERGADSLVQRCLVLGLDHEEGAADRAGQLRLLSRE